ncbi:fasciclin domain-containing protein [Elongatibacter sediminis]|uniref:Fasciclin domain-containing protein n=1 Tax=Elongatibacter sediminis TaxID=3119006 RepID=A0AAW9RGR8_9GAMM
MNRFTTCLLAGLALVLSATATAAPGKRPGGDSIVDIAVSDGRFTTLVDLVVAAGLADTLSSAGQFTVFAPTDDAFGVDATTLIGVVTGVCGSEEAALAALTNVLLYHVTDGRRFSNSVINRNNSKPIEMLNGSYVLATPGLMIIDENTDTPDANIVTGLFDISASNGVVHVIDQVLFPAELCL